MTDRARTQADERAARFDAFVAECVARSVASLEPAGADTVPEMVLAPDALVVVPIHDAFDQARRCVAALRRHTGGAGRFLLIDDASRDPRVRPWLARIASEDPRAVVKLQDTNRGYLDTVNEAIADSSGDIVLLNSDTEVGPLWLERLARAAHSSPEGGIACPISDNATLLTVLEPECIARMDASVLAGHVVSSWQGTLPRLPVAVGFCMYLTRRAIAALGGFDRAFAPGYGEENDYSLRAWKQGIEIVVAADVLVRHSGGASFGSDPALSRRRELHARILEARWPGWSAIVRGWWRDYPLRERAERLRRRIAEDGRLAVLHVSHGIARLGGAELHAEALARAAQACGVRGTFVAPSAPLASWADLTPCGDGKLDIRAMNPDGVQPNQLLLGCAADLSDPMTERTFARLLRGGGFPLIHIHHTLNWNSAILPAIARRLGARVVLTGHDFYSLCPDYNMIERPSMMPCGKHHAGVDGDCLACLSSRHVVARQERAISLQTYLDARWAVLRRAMAAVDCMIVPSVFLRDRLAGSFGEAFARRIVVVPHGISLRPPRRRRSASPVLRVGFFGGTVKLKGFDLLVEVAARLLDAPIAFHCFGGIARTPESGPVPANMRMYGASPPAELVKAYAELDVVAIPSRFEESFSLVLSEAWAAAVPVVVSDAGALPERVRQGRDGWVLPSGEVMAWVDRLRWLATAEGRRTLERMSTALRRRPIRTVRDNARDYVAIYRRLLQTPADAGVALPPPGERWDVATQRLREAVARLIPGCHASPPLEPLRSDSAVAFLVCSDGAEPAATTASLDALSGQPTCLVGPPAGGHRTAAFVSLAAATLHLESRGTRPRWLVPLDAGDLPAQELLDRLRLHDPAEVGAVYFEHGHHGAAGRYAVTAKPDWDPWQALTTPYATVAVAYSTTALAATGGWTEAAAASRYATLLALSARFPIAHERVVGLWRWDVNLGAGLGAEAQQAHAAAAARAAGPGWTSQPDGIGLDWMLIPPASAPVPVSVRVWDDRGEIEPLAALGLARQWTRYPALVAGSATGSDSAYVLIARADLDPVEPRWLETLVAWATATGAAAVAASLQDAAGNSGGAGLGCADGAIVAVDSDRAGLGPESAYAGVRQMHALSTACLLVRRESFSADELHALARPDGAAGYAAQCAARARGSRLLWIGCARMRVRGVIRGPLLGPASELALATALQTHATAPWRPAAWNRGAPVADDRCSTLPRVVAFARDDWGSSQYRVHGPLAALAAHGAIAPPLVWRTRMEPVPDLVGLAELRPDAVLYHLWLDDAGLALIEGHSRHLKARSLFLLDDLVTDIPVGHPMRSKVYPDIAERLARALACCDELIVTSTALERAYGKLARSVRVIENALDKSAWMAPRRHARAPGRRMRVGWAGAIQHQRDLELIDAVVRDTADIYDWVFLGLAPPGAHAAGATVLPMVPYARYPQALAELALDIAVAPLADDAYNRCKSALRLMELGILGIPVVASPLPCYADAPVLHAGDPDAWRSQLAVLATQPRRRKAMGRALHSWVMARHTMSVRVDAWQDAILPGTGKHDG